MGAKGPKAPADTLPVFGNLAKGFGSTANSWLGQGQGNVQSAGDFYSALLKGGKGAQNVVAPSAMQISQLYGGNAKTLQNFMPAGGERNLALAQNQIGKTRSIADLYANVQPWAAGQLGQLGMGSAGVGTGVGGLANQGFGALTGYQSQQNQAKAQSMGGIGAGLGSIAGSFLGPVKPWMF